MGDHFNIYKGKKLSVVRNTPNPGDMRYIQIEDLRNDTNLKFTPNTGGVKASDNDLVIAWDGANAGEVGFGLNGFIGSTLAVLRKKSQGIFSEYIGRYLQSKFDYIHSNCSGATIPHVQKAILNNIYVPVPNSISEQRRIAARLNAQMAAVSQARQAAEEQQNLLNDLIKIYLQESLAIRTTKHPLSECLVEVKQGIGESWNRYPVIGATRAGVAPAKEKVGKRPERYKLVEPGTILYNPMRINIGSIGMLDDGDTPGITSPDYVVFKSKKGMIHPRWFYYWFRSPYGEAFIKTLARGAVRERMLFNRLANGEVELPPWEVQCQTAEKLKEVKILKSTIESQLAEINQLPAALLRQAFSGKM